MGGATAGRCPAAADCGWTARAASGRPGSRAFGDLPRAARQQSRGTGRRCDRAARGVPDAVARRAAADQRSRSQLGLCRRDAVAGGQGCPGKIRAQRDRIERRDQPDDAPLFLRPGRSDCRSEGRADAAGARMARIAAARHELRHRCRARLRHCPGRPDRSGAGIEIEGVYLARVYRAIRPNGCCDRCGQYDAARDRAGERGCVRGEGAGRACGAGRDPRHHALGRLAICARISA